MNGSMTDFTDEEYRDIIIRAYEYLYMEVNTTQDFQYTPNKVDELAVGKFIAYIRKEYHTNNVEFILKFIETSFGFYAKNTKNHIYGLRAIMLQWVIGTSAIKRNIKLDEDYPNFPRFLTFMRTRVGASLLSKFEVETNTEITKIPNSKYIEINQVEEDFKALCPDDELQLEHCITGTFLYNHNSTKCVFCTHMIECKKLLKLNYPKINKLRGY